jgi:hypothetical protein
MKNFRFTQQEIMEYKLQEIIPSQEKVSEELKIISEKLNIQMITSTTAQQPGGPPCGCTVAELC